MHFLQSFFAFINRLKSRSITPLRTSFPRTGISCFVEYACVCNDRLRFLHRWLICLFGSNIAAYLFGFFRDCLLDNIIPRGGLTLEQLKGFKRDLKYFAFVADTGKRARVNFPLADPIVLRNQTAPRVYPNLVLQGNVLQLGKLSIKYSHSFGLQQHVYDNILAFFGQ
jgi:hypothetical protein